MSRRDSHLTPKKAGTSHGRSRSADHRLASPLLTTKASASKSSGKAKSSRPRSSSVSSVVPDEYESEASGNGSDEDYACDDPQDSSNDEENYDSDDNDEDDAQSTPPQTPIKRGHASSRAKSQEIVLASTPKTPRSAQSTREERAVTEPRQSRINREPFSLNLPYPHEKGHKSPCGRKIFQSSGSSFAKHVDGCLECQDEIRRKEKWETSCMADQDQRASLDRSVVAVRRHRSYTDESHQDAVYERQPKHQGNKNKIPSERDDLKRIRAVKPLKKVSAKDVHHELIDEICRDLTPDEKDGYVYLFQDPNKDGFVKVGFTQNVKQRKADIATECDIDLDTVQIYGPISNVRRIESLAKIDLSHRGRPWTCAKCGKKHREWFKVSNSSAKKVLSTWTEWMKQDPYDITKEDDRKVTKTSSKSGTSDRRRSSQLSRGTLKPIWSHLLKHSRHPAKLFDNHDHRARAHHWQKKALLPPLHTEFEQYNQETAVEIPRGDPATQVGPSKESNNVSQMVAALTLAGQHMPIVFVTINNYNN
jgi:hypothetical protein